MAMKKTLFSKLLFIAYLTIILTMFGCSSKRPTEICTYRELFNYSAVAMEAYKDRPSEYVSLIKDAITILRDELDENISKEGEAWTNLSDEKEIDSVILIMYFALGSLQDDVFSKKYESVEADNFFDTLKKALIYYGEKYYKQKK